MFSISEENLSASSFVPVLSGSVVLRLTVFLRDKWPS